MNKYRLKFSKSGKMIYIGHLDLLKFFIRLIKRTQLPIAYSNGFNPHQQLTFAIPLSLGMTSYGEYLDIQLTAPVDCEEIKNRCNQALPSGIEILKVRELSEGEKNCASAIVAADYKVYIDKKIENLKDIIVYKIENLDSSQSEIPLDVLNPKYTYDQLMKIDTLLGSYETYFNPKRKNRVNNITVAAKSTSDILVNTNEKFSFNQQLRDNDAYNKLKVASIILNGKHDKGVGGGICQVSTTIYNAALYAGMDIVQITNHSIPSPYVTKGRDATVSNGSMDFVFKNNNNNPIIVHNEIFENKIASKIYGCSSDKRNIEIETEIVETIKNKKIYKSDSKLQKGTKVVEQEGRLGYTVNTFRLYKSNNEILKKELVNTSYYPPCDEIILKGTKDNTLYK